MNTIRKGSKGPDVTTWQKVLNAGDKPSTWMNTSGTARAWPANWPWPLTADGDFGMKTEWATEAWQARNGLEADGVVGGKSWGKAMTLGLVPEPSKPVPVLLSGDVPFLPAKNFTRGRGTNNVRLLIVHTMENREIPKSARGAAGWFVHQPAAGTRVNDKLLPDPNGTKIWGGSSAHYCFDVLETLMSVREQDTAWHAGAVNPYSIGLEHAGYAAQTPDEWADGYSVSTLLRSADKAAELCIRYNIPALRLSPGELRAGKAGFAGHVDVNVAYNGGKGHWDPGKSFPWQWYLAEVATRIIKAGGSLELAIPQVTWSEVTLENERYLVAPFMVQGVGIGEALHYSRVHNCVLPTPELVKAIHKHADLRVPPHPQAHDGGADMYSKSMFDEQSGVFAKQLAGHSYRLLSGTHKDVVQSPHGAIGIFGWIDPTGTTTIQSFFGGHSLSWKDYSQGWRPVKRLIG